MSRPLDSITFYFTRKQAAEIQQALLSLLKENVRASKSVSELEHIVSRVHEIDTIIESELQKEQESRLTTDREPNTPNH